MNIKWNWGTKLALWIVAFVLFILSLVYMSLGYDVNLVEKDYYPKGLAYQDRINAIDNAMNLNISFNVSQLDNNISIITPEIHSDSGTITFFRPSDVDADRVYKLLVNKQVTIPVVDFQRGKYIVKFHWWYDNQEFYMEEIINIK